MRAPVDASRGFSELNGQSLNFMFETFPPMAMAFTKWTMELVRFGAKRANEYNELPGRMAKCQSAADLYAEQIRFFTSLREDYAEETGRMLDLVTRIPGGGAVAVSGAAVFAPAAMDVPDAGEAGMEPVRRAARKTPRVAA